MSLIGAIHIQTRSTSLTVHLARPAKLITVRGGEFCCSRAEKSIRRSFSSVLIIGRPLFFPFFNRNFLFPIGRTLPREEGQARTLPPFSLSLSRSWRRNLSEIPSGRLEVASRLLLFLAQSSCFEVRDKYVVEV